MDELRRQLAEAPRPRWWWPTTATACSSWPPSTSPSSHRCFDQAQLAIDALGCLVEGLGAAWARPGVAPRGPGPGPAGLRPARRGTEGRCRRPGQRAPGRLGRGDRLSHPGGAGPSSALVTIGLGGPHEDGEGVVVALDRAPGRALLGRFGRRRARTRRPGPPAPRLHPAEVTGHGRGSSPRSPDRWPGAVGDGGAVERGAPAVVVVHRPQARGSSNRPSRPTTPGPPRRLAAISVDDLGERPAR